MPREMDHDLRSDVCLSSLRLAAVIAGVALVLADDAGCK